MEGKTVIGRSMKKQSKYRLAVGAASFWQKLYLDTEYLHGLHLQGMDCEDFTIQKKQGTVENGFQLELYSKPKLSIPSALRRVLGKSVSYVEHGEYSPQTNKYTFRMVPSVLPKKILISGVCWIVPVDDNHVDRFLELEFSVKMFGVGKLLEGFIAQSNLDNQEKAIQFTKKWLQ